MRVRAAQRQTDTLRSSEEPLACAGLSIAQLVERQLLRACIVYRGSATSRGRIRGLAEAVSLYRAPMERASAEIVAEIEREFMAKARRRMEK
jgi:hypothetical protein